MATSGLLKIQPDFLREYEQLINSYSERMTKSLTAC